MPSKTEAGNAADKSLTGLIFDIKEFAVHDGPGIRTTVFMKGCHLACSWCHNPEGLLPIVQVVTGKPGRRTAGTIYTADELAAYLNSQADILNDCEGGVTFSGGEPLMQAAFVEGVIDRLDRIHVLIDTSGYAERTEFQRVVSKSDMVYFDLKMMDNKLHEQFTGRGNSQILSNLELMPEMGVEYVIRIPLVPGVTDTPENLAAIADHMRGRPGLIRVDLLPYNLSAGAKYESVGLAFEPGFDEYVPVNADTKIFSDRGIPVLVC